MKTMMTVRIALAALICAGAAFAQEDGTSLENRFRGPEQLQMALELTDTQVQQLRDNNRAMGDVVRPIAREINDKRRELRRESRGEAPNEAIVGALNVEIEELRAQIDAIHEEYHAMARGLLTFEQLFALQPIEAAAAHAFEVRQAAQFNLIVLPEVERSNDGPNGGNNAGRRR